MSFALGLGLFVGLLAAVPFLAHLLRKGKTQEHAFPPARLVPPLVVTSEQRTRLEDRALMSARMLLVLALAVMAAGPLMQCSRLSVERSGGASVALAIVVDDSQSMRARTKSGDTRFELAQQGVEELARSLRRGDSVAVISAGTPARVLLGSTTDLSQLKPTMSALQVSDRATALQDAVTLAASTLKSLPHADKRVILLSDLADTHSTTPATPEGITLSIPLPALAEPLDNCGISLAERSGSRIEITYACTSPQAAQGRAFQLYSSGEVGQGEPLATLALEPLSGTQRALLKYESLGGVALTVNIDGQDALVADDTHEVVPEGRALSFAVVADPSRASAITGGPTVLEQAIRALRPDVAIRPLAILPEALEDLRPYAGLLVDDPPGLAPEARSALNEWIDQGGVALGLLGPSAATVQLSASLEPFAREGATWESEIEATLDTASLAWLGPEADSLKSAGLGNRVRLDAVDLPGTRVRGRWSDGVPWLFVRDQGRGVVLTTGLPVSLQHSDLGLRPGFLALLDHTLRIATERSGVTRGFAGDSWLFQAAEELQVSGPDGPVALTPISGDGSRQISVSLAGSYKVTIAETEKTRLVMIDPKELASLPKQIETSGSSATEQRASPLLDISPEWALFLLLLFAIELGLRVFRTRSNTGAAGAVQS